MQAYRSTEQSSAGSGSLSGHRRARCCSSRSRYRSSSSNLRNPVKAGSRPPAAKAGALPCVACFAGGLELPVLTDTKLVRMIRGLAVSVPVRAFFTLFRPLIWVLEWSTEVVLHWLRLQPPGANDEVLSEAERDVDAQCAAARAYAFGRWQQHRAAAGPEVQDMVARRDTGQLESRR